MRVFISLENGNTKSKELNFFSYNHAHSSSSVFDLPKICSSSSAEADNIFSEKGKKRKD
ncbi:hypothetical protein BVRB_4g096190 [Beta vulgaris subsp. vulgaris]|uniref:Uncharacterized protein n=1 Tax=Beta vulgaris subsp. vulgaris TaxID=3555 RepID=A0A0J8BDD6_BETVV|nr:hypothetical protein BVRB_4g096190 [Beta vulgaris subsp. vulgaris]